MIWGVEARASKSVTGLLPVHGGLSWAAAVYGMAAARVSYESVALSSPPCPLPCVSCASNAAVDAREAVSALLRLRPDLAPKGRAR